MSGPGHLGQRLRRIECHTEVVIVATDWLQLLKAFSQVPGDTQIEGCPLHGYDIASGY